jgi:hypothetical protein
MYTRFSLPLALLTAAALGLLHPYPARAQWAVIDAANLQQSVKQVTAWAAQHQDMLQHLQQLESTYAAITGGRGMQSLLPIALATRNYLPMNNSDLMNVLNGISTNYPILANQVQGIMASHAVLSNHQIATLSPQAQQVLLQGRQAAAALAMLSQQSHASSSGNFGQLQGLITALGMTPDTKASADLQGRIAAEQVMTTNNQIKTDAMYQTVQAQELLRQQQVSEQVVESVGDWSTRRQAVIQF